MQPMWQTMWELLQQKDVDLITYGCSAHLLNVLAKDLEIPNIKISKNKCVGEVFLQQSFRSCSLQTK